MKFATLSDMRKLFILLFLGITALTIQAESFDASATYIYSSDHNQARAGFSVPLGLNVALGLEGKYVEDKFAVADGARRDPVYSVYVPLQLDLEIARLAITPFYYFKNRNNIPLPQSATAYGINSRLTMILRQDDVDEVFTHAYLEIAYARQKGSLLENNTWENQYYDQAAFTLGVNQNFFNSFVFQAAATAYQYPDGISHVTDFRGILDQKDLGFVQSYDVSRSLGKYVLSARIARVWAEKNSSLYLGYHYAEAYTDNPQHSVLLGNTFRVSNNIYMDAAYNHLQSTKSQNRNKRDLFFVNINVAF